MFLLGIIMKCSKRYFYIVIFSFIFCVENITCSQVGYPLGYSVQFNEELQRAEIFQPGVGPVTVHYNSLNSILRYDNLGFTKNGGLIIYDNQGSLLSTSSYIAGRLAVCDHTTGYVYFEDLNDPNNPAFYQIKNDLNNAFYPCRLTLKSTQSQNQ